MRRSLSGRNELYAFVADIQVPAGVDYPANEDGEDVFTLAENIEKGSQYLLEVGPDLFISETPANILLWRALRFLRYSQIRIKVCQDLPLRGTPIRGGAYRPLTAAALNRLRLDMENDYLRDPF